MARCNTCGRRWLGNHPECGLVQRDWPTDLAHPQITNLVIPGYSASKVLGRGGFGIVVQATRVSDGPPVAIKIAHRDNAQAATRLEVEAEPLRSIGPPFVPALYEEGNLPNGSRYLVMELINL